MKRFTQYVCLILAFAVFGVIPASAIENGLQRSSAYFARYSVYIHKVSSAKFEVWFDITAVDYMDKLGAKEIKVQRSTDEENWTTMQTWHMDDYGNLIAEDTVRHGDYVSHYYASGYYYRAVVVFYAKQGSSYGELTITSQTYES